MERLYFKFFRSFRDAARGLPDLERLSFYDNMLDYALDETQPDLTGITAAMWILVKPNIDKGIQNYKNAIKRNESESGAKPERNESESGAIEKPIESPTIGISLKDKGIKDKGIKDKGIKDNGIMDNGSESGAKTDPPLTDPAPEPTLENIADYLKSINSTKSPDKVYTIMGETLKLAPDWRVIVKAWSEERR